MAVAMASATDWIHMSCKLRYLAAGQTLGIDTDRGATSASCTFSIHTELSQTIHQILNGSLPHSG